MLMLAASDTVQSQGLGEGNSFTIASSAKAFEVLSSSLYQNKILAVVREITCNAADAHTITGRPLSDIKVQCPSFVAPYFSVRDYGPGLSHSDVLNLYTTYFRSTKDSDNKQIGGFGLGSKAPFAVADQFTVTSWHDGRRRTYVCFKDGGAPAINLVGDEPAPTSDTGIEVKVAVAPTAQGEWARAASNFFQWWPVLPSITLAQPFAISRFWEGPTAPSIQSDVKVNGLPAWAPLQAGQPSVVYMGMVAYPLNLSAIPSLPPRLAQLCEGHSFFLNFPMGEVSVSPSREALSYTPATCAALIRNLTALFRELGTAYRTALDNQSTLWDARRYLYSTSQKSVVSLVRFLTGKDEIFWRGKLVPLISTLETKDLAPLASLDVWVKSTRRVNPEKTSTDSGFFDHSATATETRFFWASKTPRNCRSVLSSFFTNSKTWKAVILKGGSYDEAVALCLRLGLPSPLDYASLPVPTAMPRSKSAVTSRTRGYAFTPNCSAYDRLVADLNLQGGGIYFDFAEGVPDARLHACFLRLLSAGFFNNTGVPRVIGISYADRSKSKALTARLAENKWQLFNWEWVHTNVSTAWLRTYSIRQTVSNWVMHRRLTNQTFWKRGSSVPHAPLFDLLRSLENQMAATFLPLWSPDSKASLSTDQQKAFDAGAAFEVQLNTAWKDFVDAHPLVAQLPLDCVPSAHLNAYLSR
jgi:hypothetical protein